MQARLDRAGVDPRQMPALPLSRVDVPTQVRLVSRGGEDWIEWDPYSLDPPEGRSVDASGALWALQGLSGASPGAILTFARRRGVLGLCEHGGVFHHAAGNPCRWLERPDGWAAEPISAWRYYAATTESMLRIAAALRAPEEGFVVTEDDWEMLTKAPSGGVKSLVTSSGLIWSARDGDPWRMLGEALRELIAQSGMRPRLVHLGSAEGGMVLSDHVDVGLLGSVALQLATTVSVNDRLYRCDSPFCGRLYSRRRDASTPLARRPKRGQKGYCDPCREMRYSQVNAARQKAKRAAMRTATPPDGDE